MNYPPQIEGKIASQYGDTLQVPFTMGYTSSLPTKIYARIKTIVNNEILGIIEHNNILNNVSGNLIAVFEKPEELKLEIGQFYKIQLGIDNSNGVYSTTGVFKYTNTPKVEISNLTPGALSAHQYKYTAIYTNDDVSE
jgi:hypothetical protein